MSLRQIALISDIHGNLVSFEAVLADIERRNISEIICLGDVAATGPQPKACIDRLQTLNCPVIMGNTDERLLDPDKFDFGGEHGHIIEAIDNWCLQQLSPENLAFVQTFQSTLQINFSAEVALLCYHGSPQNNTDIIRSDTPNDDIKGFLHRVQASFFAGGHTHQPMLRHYKDRLLVNPGSVGLPYVEDAKTGQGRNPAWAEYAIVGYDQGNLAISFQRVPIDLELVKQSALNSGMPFVEEWLADW